MFTIHFPLIFSQDFLFYIHLAVFPLIQKAGTGASPFNSSYQDTRGIRNARRGRRRVRMRNESDLSSTPRTTSQKPESPGLGSKRKRPMSSPSRAGPSTDDSRSNLGCDQSEGGEQCIGINKRRRRSTTPDPSKKYGIKRWSIFYQLPYWEVVLYANLLDWLFIVLVV